MKTAGLTIHGTLDDLLEKVDVVVDCSPKKIGAENVKKYQSKEIKFILQGGEKHEVTGHSFVAESNFETAISRNSTRVVSCNTTSIVRTLGALKRRGLLKRARGTLLRRARVPISTKSLFGRISYKLKTTKSLVDNQAIVIPKTIDAIRALMGTTLSALESIQMTNKSLEIKSSFLKGSNDKY